MKLNANEERERGCYAIEKCNEKSLSLLHAPAEVSNRKALHGVVLYTADISSVILEEFGG
jgi:hypothetical protein